MEVVYIKYSDEQRAQIAAQARDMALEVQSSEGPMSAADWNALRARYKDPFYADMLMIFRGFDDHYRDTAGGLVKITWRNILDTVRPEKLA